MRLNALGVLSALLVGCTGGLGRPTAAEGSEHPLVGAAAPAFELKAVQGTGAFGPAELAGKVAIVDFWATWCEPCKKSFPFYERLAKSHAGELQILGVSVDEDSSGIRDFAAATGVSFPLVWDEGQAVSRLYRPPSMPTSYFIDRSGIVRAVHEGFHEGDEQVIGNHVKSLLAQP